MATITSYDFFRTLLNRYIFDVRMMDALKSAEYVRSRFFSLTVGAPPIAHKDFKKEFNALNITLFRYASDNDLISTAIDVYEQLGGRRGFVEFYRDESRNRLHPLQRIFNYGTYFGGSLFYGAIKKATGTYVHVGKWTLKHR